MTDLATGCLGIVILFALILLRIPVALSMFAVGFLGISYLSGANAALSLLASETFTLASKFELIVIPLFILMGNVASRAGMSATLYNAAFVLVGRLRGGLAISTLLGCGAFAALSGSSVASALTMGRVSLKEMERYNYAPRLSTASVAAGGTLGILIPPSTGFVLYALLTEQSIGRLFLAGLLPGLLLLLLFAVTVLIVTRRHPEMGPAGTLDTASRPCLTLFYAVPAGAIIIVTVGGLYAGLFSPTESAAVGSGLLIMLGLASRTLSLKDLWQCGMESALTTASLMLIVIAAHLINPFLALSHIPQYIGELLTNNSLPAIVVLMIVLLCYMGLGMFMDGLAMLVLTLPIFFPVVTALGYDPIWFGVMVMIVLEMGLLSPPVGMNVFIVHSVAPHVPQNEIFQGAVPFWGAMLVSLGLLTLFPNLATALPNLVIGR